jgi:hypothetical protein
LRTKENHLWKFFSYQRNGSPHHLQIVDLYDKRKAAVNQKHRLTKGILVSGSLLVENIPNELCTHLPIMRLSTKSKHVEKSHLNLPKWL